MVTFPNIQAMLNELASVGIMLGINAGVPTNAVTGAGVYGPGSLVFDTTGKKWYVNTNTLASPTWIVLGTQS